jgi:hypothetical protein
MQAFSLLGNLLPPVLEISDGQTAIAAENEIIFFGIIFFIRLILLKVLLLYFINMNTEQMTIMMRVHK